ncbi:hypothetical protein [Streptomyces sp. NPDC047024]|uniref:hypothetical protein n=1 Tax=Streptomyces sp. NPDC047024 TaxID=3155476 RepID=UPI0033E63927
MPGRQDRTRDFREETTIERPPSLGGLWEVDVTTGRGQKRRLTVDTTGFRCRRLADELAAELVDYANLLRPSPAGALVYRKAILELCAFVDRSAGPDAAACSLASPEPDVSALIRAWWQTLPAQFPEGSTVPCNRAAYLLALIRFRGQHPERELAPAVQRLTVNPVPPHRGSKKELVEFTRAERDRLVRAAWAHIRDLKRRLQHGRELVAGGADPRTAGWLTPANLAFGLAKELVTPAEIRARLSDPAQWPPGLLDLCAMAGHDSTAEGLVAALVDLIYPSTVDLFPFRILLVAATGHAPEEVTFLTEEDVEFVPGGVRLRLVKRRAHKARSREFRARQGEHEVVHPDRAKLNVAEALRELMDATADARPRYTSRSPYLFTSAELTRPKDDQPGGDLVFAPFDTRRTGGAFAGWLKRWGVTVGGKQDIRRLRKSAKVEKVIAFRGVVSDAADDHTEQVFWAHYAHGTALRVMAGSTITKAQQTWLEKALEGPTVLSEEAAGQLDDPEVLDGLGLTAEQAEEIRQGELDMGVSNCRDPYDSPYGRPGELCAVAPLRCLECRNAFVLPSNLPQLLLFAENLEALAARLDPRVFHRTWGQSRTNLRAVLDDVPTADLEQARQQIADQDLRLQLPLAANVEFDS